MTGSILHAEDKVKPTGKIIRIFFRSKGQTKFMISLMLGHGAYYYIYILL